MGLLTDLLRSNSRTGRWKRLRGKQRIPTVEWLLVSDGRPDPTIRYLVGCTVPDLTPDVEGVLRMAFPDSYEFHQLLYHPRFVEGHLPIVTSDARSFDRDDWDSPLHPAITTAHPYAAGVEFGGRASRSNDWQTPLKPFEAFCRPAINRRHSSEATPRVPLAAVIETMHDAQVPVVFQVICRPLGDWTSSAEQYLIDLNEGTVPAGEKVWEFFDPRDREARNAYRPPPADAERIEGIMARDPTQTLTVLGPRRCPHYRRAIACPGDRRADSLTRSRA
ncbi:MAG: hypothetical protein U5J98_06020 [Halobacteriales archaeon]|nr:hypothetical protein [Halobacteriales archaeon]